MSNFPEGNAIVYCEGCYNTTNGKTAHGLVRYTRRYHVLSVIDSTLAGKDAAEFLDGKPKGIPIYPDLKTAISEAKKDNTPATYFVIGLAPDGGRLSDVAREAVAQAIKSGLNVDCGLHDFLSEDTKLASLAQKHKVKIRDVRKPPPISELHFFSGKIEQVDSFKVAVLGVDSASGKRTTAVMLVDALRKAGYSTEMIGTGQTAWMQGIEYGIRLDSLINDFVSGEIEHIVWQAWNEKHPKIIVISGQGSLLNPAYPGGFEILAAGRPDVIVLQDVPARKEYDGFPGYPIQPIETQIQALELISGKPVVAITINHENLSQEQIPQVCKEIAKRTGRPVCDILVDGAQEIVSALLQCVSKKAPKKIS